MSSRIVKQLRESPSAELAYNSALDVLNGSLAGSTHLDDLQRVLDDARNAQVQLEQHVRVKPTSLYLTLISPQLIESEKEIDILTTNTRAEAILQLNKAKELASLWDSLEDDLAYLSHDLVSALSPTGGDSNGSTLLEDIETLHRASKELESVRSYVAVVERTLQLR